MAMRAKSAEGTVYTSPAELFKDLPKDAFPKFGPQSVAQRAAARAWMQKNLIGRTIEWTAVVDNIEYGLRGDPTRMRINFHNVTAQSDRLGEAFPVGISGCSWGTNVLGDQAAHAIVGTAQRGPVGQGLIIYRSGPHYMLVYDHWTADEAKQAFAWKKGHEIKLRSEITAADVCDGGTWTSEKIDDRGNGKTYPRIPLWIQVTLPSVNGLLPAALQPKLVRLGEPITCVAFSLDAKLMLINNDLWDVEKFAKLRTLELPPLAEGEYRSRKVSDAAFHNDDKHVAIGQQDGTIQVWDTSTGKEVARLMHEQTQRFHPGETYVAYTLDGKLLLSSRAGGMARVWEAATGKPIRDFEWNPDAGGMFGSPTVALATTFDGKRAAISGSGGRTVLWDLEANRPVYAFNAHINEHLSTAAVFSRDCRQLLHGVETAGTVVVWDMATQKELRRLESPPGFEATVTSVACSPNGKIAAAGLANHRIHLWEIATGKLVRVFRGHEARITSLAFSPDEKYLLSGSDDRTARLWGLRE